MSGKMGTKFCFGNSPISSGYAIGYFGIAIRLFLIPNLIALASYKVMKMHKMKEDGEAESEAEPEGEFENGTGIHFEKVILMKKHMYFNFFMQSQDSFLSLLQPALIDLEDTRPFNLHPDFSRVSPRPDFSGCCLKFF